MHHRRPLPRIGEADDGVRQPGCKLGDVCPREGEPVLPEAFALRLQDRP
jgi:hypothetical protein